MNPKDPKIISLTVRIPKLEKVNNSPQSTMTCNQQIGHGSSYGKGKVLKKSYVNGLYNIGYWRIKNTKDNITWYETDWLWFTNHNVAIKFDIIYTYHYPDKNDEWS